MESICSLLSGQIKKVIWLARLADHFKFARVVIGAWNPINFLIVASSDLPLISSLLENIITRLSIVHIFSCLDKLRRRFARLLLATLLIEFRSGIVFARLIHFGDENVFNFLNYRIEFT